MYMTTYSIRLEAIMDTYNDGGDTLLLKRELMGLERDIGRAVKSARLVDDVSVVVLIDLLDAVWVKIDGLS